MAWQLADRACPWPSEALAEVWPGVPIVVDKDDYIASEIYRGFYERELVTLLRALVRPGGLAVDVGANVGYHTTLLSKAAGEGGRVLAFEPHPTNARRLAALVEAAGLSNVALVTSAVGASPGRASLGLVDEPGHSGLATLRADAPVGGGTVEVDVVALDDVEALSDVEIDVLKIDVEGFEAEVLAGARSLLHDARVRHIVVEVSPNFGSIAYAGRLLRTATDSWRAFVIDERGRLRRRLALHPVSADGLDSLVDQSNVLVSRQDAVGVLAPWLPS